METNFKKIDREYLLSDSSLNTYSYRLLTSGYLFDEFKKNPIGYYMHGTPEFPREEGVLVKWDDLRIDGDKVYGKPCINLNHSRGQRTVGEIEAGFLNAASFGQIVAIEISSNPEDYLPGQTGPSLSKWFNRECSLVDIPGNYCATADDLLDANNNPLNLSNFKIKKITMEKIILTPAQLAAIPNLKADATQGEVDTAINNLIAEAGKVNKLTTDLAAANTAKDTAETALATFKADTAKAEVKDLVAKAVEEKRITVEAGNSLTVQFEGKAVELKALLATFKPYEGVVAQLGGKEKNVADLVAKTYDELDKSGKLEDLKAAKPDIFFEKYEGKYGKKHQDDPAGK